MASLSRDANGTFRIRVIVSGKRKCVRLGRLTRKAADAVRLRVEHLAAASSSGLPIDSETAAWVGGIGDDLAVKLAKAGLVSERPKERSRRERNGGRRRIALQTQGNLPSTPLGSRRLRLAR